METVRAAGHVTGRMYASAAGNVLQIVCFILLRLPCGIRQPLPHLQARNDPFPVPSIPERHFHSGGRRDHRSEQFFLSLPVDPAAGLRKAVLWYKGAADARKAAPFLQALQAVPYGSPPIGL